MPRQKTRHLPTAEANFERWNFIRILLKLLGNFSLQMSNVITANFSYTNQWLLSNIKDFTMWTQQVMNKISHRIMNSVWSLFKVSKKDTRTTFLLLTLNKFHTSFGGLKSWHESYLSKFFWLKLYSQYLLRCIYYALFNKIRQGGDTASGTVLHKRCCKTSG